MNKPIWEVLTCHPTGMGKQGASRSCIPDHAPSARAGAVAGTEGLACSTGGLGASESPPGEDGDAGYRFYCLTQGDFSQVIQDTAPRLAHRLFAGQNPDAGASWREQRATGAVSKGQRPKAAPDLRLQALVVQRPDLRSYLECHGFPAGASRRSSSDQLSTMFNCVGADSCSLA